MRTEDTRAGSRLPSSLPACCIGNSAALLPSVRPAALLTAPPCPSWLCAETLRTEVPPLLHEVSKQLKRSAGTEPSLLSADASYDELACLRTGSGHNEGAGCSATWVPGAQGPSCSLADAADAAGAAGDGVSSSSSSTSEGGLPLDGHAVALLLTLCPPLALAASNPDNFLGALEVSTASGVGLLIARGWNGGTGCSWHRRAMINPVCAFNNHYPPPCCPTP